MTLGSKEFDEVMVQFEKSARELVSMGTMGLTREPKENWKRQQYYSDGNANNAFILFLHGVSFGRVYFSNL